MKEIRIATMADIEEKIGSGQKNCTKYYSTKYYQIIIKLLS